MDMNNIIRGHINEVLGLNKDISRPRLEICYACPLYSVRLGGLCDNNLWLNKNTGDTSDTPKEGYTRGCGCRLKAKTRLPNEKCPLGKW